MERYQELQVLKINAFKTSDGTVFEKEEDADQYERMHGLSSFCNENGIKDPDTAVVIKGEPLFAWVVVNKRKLIRFLRSMKEK